MTYLNMMIICSMINNGTFYNVRYFKELSRVENLEGDKVLMTFNKISDNNWEAK